MLVGGFAFASVDVSVDSGEKWHLTVLEEEKSCFW